MGHARTTPLGLSLLSSFSGVLLALSPSPARGMASWSLSSGARCRGLGVCLRLAVRSPSLPRSLKYVVSAMESPPVPLLPYPPSLEPEGGHRVGPWRPGYLDGQRVFDGGRFSKR